MDYAGGRTLDELIEFVEKRVAGVSTDGDDDDDGDESDVSDDEGDGPEVVKDKDEL